MKNFSAVLLLFVSICFVHNLDAQKSTEVQESNALMAYDGQTLVTKAKFLGKSSPMTELEEVKNWSTDKIAERKKALPKKFFPNFRNRKAVESPNPKALPQGADPVWQAEGRNTDFVVDPIVDMDGMSSANSNANPPDPSGTIGRDHFIQMVNATLFQIFDKDGTAITGPTNMSAFWAQFGLNSGGDPIVLYDEAADRWVFTEFPSGQNFLLIAVSDTSDPLGEWNAYQFSTPSFPDYPKYGIFDKAIVVTTNEGGGLPVYCIDRQAMLDGSDDVDIARLTIPSIAGGPGFQVTTPVNQTGQLATDDGNPMIVRMVDDAWGESDEDLIELWTVEVDFENIEDCTIELSSQIATTPFDSNPCLLELPGNLFSCIPQPNGQGIDGLREVIMNHSQYRNFGGHESIVLNFISDASGDNLSGIRWMELRRLNNCEDWLVHQEGTYAPDADHRFMGGIAIDAFGNIGLAYNISNIDRFPSIAFTGRKKSDPLGNMTICEHVVAEGEGNSSVRFGDYAQMTVDPVDGRTFWYTGEYMGPGNGNWRTRIFSFQIPLDSIDLASADVTTPLTSSFLNDQEEVTIIVQNLGEDVIDGFQVSYSFQGNTIGPVDIDSTLLQGESFEYTFVETIDASVPGNYEILSIVNTGDDAFAKNDTLRYCFTKLGTNDAGIVDLDSDLLQVCSDSTSITATIENFSDAPLTSADLIVSVNGTVQNTIPWTGNLGLGDTETLLLPVTGLIDGNNDVLVTTALPNGNPDEIQDNDELTFTLNALTNALEFTLELQLDFFANETSWTIVSENGMTVAQGGGYGTRELIIETFCVDPDLCYTFTINDSYGDGLVGLNGTQQGDYRIINDENQVVASLMELNFGFQETNEFCGFFVCNLMGSIDISPETAVGAMDGVINITPQNGVAPFEYSIDGGTTTSANAMFTDLPAGTYDIWIIDGNECNYTSQVVLTACDLDFTTELVNASNSNSLDGSITINVSGGTAPFQYSIDGGFSFQGSNLFEGLPTDAYDVIVRDAAECTLEREIELNSTVSTNNTFLGTDIKIYPNPTLGLFTVEIKSSNLNQNYLEYELLDATGKLVLNDELPRYNDFYIGQISILTSPNGIYYLRIVDDRVQKMTKIVKE